VTKFNFKKVNLYQYKLDNGILDFTVISNCLDKFFNDIMNPLENPQYVTFQLVYKLSDNTFRSLGYLNKINKEDLDTLNSSLLLFFQNAFDQYNEAFKETIAIYIKYRYLDMSKSEHKSLIVDTKN
jgi:hypothetical protein